MVLVVIICVIIKCFSFICDNGPLSVSSSVVTGGRRRCREWITVDGWIESNQIKCDK